MALPDPPAPKRPLWQNASMLVAMIAFLVFSDWFNPGDKNVQLADGTKFQATLQYETRGQYDLRLKEAVLGHQPDEVVRFDPGAPASYGHTAMPGGVLGPPEGRGDAAGARGGGSLGEGGSCEPAGGDPGAGGARWARSSLACACGGGGGCPSR